MKQNRNAFSRRTYSLILSAVVLTILIVVNILVNALPENLTKYDISAAKLLFHYQQYKGGGKRVG